MPPRRPRKKSVSNTNRKKAPQKKKRAQASKQKKQIRKKQSNKASIVSKIKWRYVILFFLLLFSFYVLFLDIIVLKKFDGKRWALPAKVYARPLELYSGLNLSKATFLDELKLLGFRNKAKPESPGSYLVSGNDVLLTTRAFQFWDEKTDSKVLKISFTGDSISSVYDYLDEREIDIIRMEPAIIGGIYPAHKEDRILVKLESVPELLKSAIRIVEDRHFYLHHGLHYKGIARALLANIRAGKTVQGGSTLTQQLVKNFFLSNTRSLWRKLNEAIMSLLLEFHFDKDEIFEAYINEVYLGQDKARAIHGFGLASRFYFDKNLDDLELHHVAMLVALVKGPSYYSPRRYSKRLLKRRNLVIDLLAEFKIITLTEAKQAKRKSLGIIKTKPSSISSHPAFLDLVKRQLKTFYRDKDLASEGLQIFTTLDPLLQKKVEKIVERKTKWLDKRKHLNKNLQAATIITNTTNSEVLALVSGRNPEEAGFNRALDAIRPIGSLIKPAVYLAALQQDNFNPLTLLNDKKVHIKGPAGDVWSPRNYDKKEHGAVAFYQALTHSYNLATVRLGLKIGFEPIQQTIRDMGVKRKIPAYPSMLLGSVNMSPYEVTQMYHSLASGGFNMPLNAIREVLAIDGTPLKRFALKVQQTLDVDKVTIINSILRNVLQTGTAKRIRYKMPPDFNAAGKTGTTNDLRDSWFAGFSAQHLVVSWLGTDDNRSTGLSGSSGALEIWSDIMRAISTKPLVFNSNASVEYLAIDPVSLKRVNVSCENAVLLALPHDDIPSEQGDCQ